jgi:DNA adenine methylase
MVKPFLKWPGGKRWILPHIASLFRDRVFGTYFEPFLGGGAVFFGLAPRQAVLSDINSELITTYCQVRDAPNEVLDRLKDLAVDRATYYRLREWEPRSDLDKAVRFLYLNRTAFAGMYRLNQQGKFNVPFGGGQRTPEPLWRDNLLISASTALRDVTVIQSDFEPVLKRAVAGDLVYCDPTYTVAHNSNGFIRYNERNFSWCDQKRLAKVAADSAKRGVTVLVSNAAQPEIRDLYPNAHVAVLQRKTLLSPRPEKRRSTEEYLLILDGSIESELQTISRKPDSGNLVWRDE